MPSSLQHPVGKAQKKTNQWPSPVENELNKEYCEMESYTAEGRRRPTIALSEAMEPYLDGTFYPSLVDLFDVFFLAKPDF